MATTTVTPAAPVAANSQESEFNVQESLNQASSEQLDHWMKTGELPGEKKSETTPAADKNGKTGDDTTRASETRTATQEKEQTPAPQRTPRTAENRYHKLSRENADLRAENERLKAAQPAKSETARETTAETRSAQPEPAKTGAAPKPKLDDVGSDGKPKYKTYAEFEDARDKWNRDEAIREFRETTNQSEQQKAQEAAKTRVNQEIQKRVEQARQDHSDYDDVCAAGLSAKDKAGRDLIFIPEGSHLQMFFLDSDRGQDVLYEILKDPEAHAAIFERNEKGDKFVMSQIRQLRELAKIEAGLEPKAAAAASSSSAPKKTPPKLPPPATELSARNSAPGDEAEAALARGDTGAYMRIVNQREIKARK